MLSIHVIRTSFLSVIALALAVTVSSNSITSPTVCLSDIECPSTSFCNGTVFSQLPHCVPRLPKNSPCNNGGLGQCKEGLTCIFDPSSGNNDGLCRPRVPRGGNCRLGGSSSCVAPLVCHPNTTTCQPFTDGFAGSPCGFDDSRCQQDKGFYCQTEPGVCGPKLAAGDECFLAADNFECLGFCAIPPDSSGNAVCVSSSKEGGPCTADDQCESSFSDRPGPRVNRIICNIPSGLVGRCMRMSSLITRLGGECDPDLDKCDARRSLNCHPTRNGQHLCQHRLSRFDFQFHEFCEPQSPLSRCSWGDEKAECRLERDVPGESSPLDPRPFFVCRRKSENVPRGGVCAAEYAACANGTECREVPGVRPEPLESFVRFPPPRVVFCVHIAKQGENCGGVDEKFTTQCENGLRCENGTCVKSKMNKAPFDETMTHAGLRALCSGLPCAPGLVCDNYEFDSTKRCLLPLKIVGKGRACTDRVGERRRCENGLVCALRKDGTNIRRCREPREAGDYCQGDSDCSEGLACPAVVRGNREQEDRRCYDPKTTLSLGDACDPDARAFQPGCVVNERPIEFFPNETTPEPMACMPKAGGFACRVVVGLFDFCDEAKDIACDNGLKCGDYGVCIPAGEN